MRSASIAVSLDSSRFPDQVTSGLFVQWCLHLAKTRLHIEQWGSENSPYGKYHFGSRDGKYFEIKRTGSRGWQVAEYFNIESEALSSLVYESARLAEAGNTGEEVLYRTTLKCKSANTGDPNFTLNLIRLMSDSVSILGSRRIGNTVLLDFRESLDEASKGAAPFGPDVEIAATLFVPGPTAGYLSDQVASSLTEIVAAICAHALGRPVQSYIQISPFSLTGEEVEREAKRRNDIDIKGLAKKSVDLDIFGTLSVLGDNDATIRARNCLVTLHEVKRQTNADVATMLYVGAIEALISPPAQLEWGKMQVTRRFRDGVLSLCTDAVDALLAHKDIEPALGFKKQGRAKWQRRQLVDHIYTLRSIPTHTGIAPGSVGIMQLIGGQAAKIAMLSDLATAALHGYMQEPRSFLTGHPGLADTP